MKTKITVATVVWNPGPLLLRTLQSVAGQDYPHVQHLIVDGRSTDNTLPLLHEYQADNSRSAIQHEITVLSEPDNGLYDAMNKAIGLATGDYILFLNAGDKFHSADVLSKIAATATGQPGVIYGNTDIVDNEGTFLHRRRLQPPRNLGWKSFKNGMLVCHQAFFARTDLARENLYNLKYRFSADFDWCIRIMKTAQSGGLALADANIIVADYLNEGMTTKNHRKSLLERMRIMIIHYGLPATLWQHGMFVLRAIRRKLAGRKTA